MALDKQITIYTVDTAHFYFDREARLHKKNCICKCEKKKLRESQNRILKIVEEKDPDVANLLVRNKPITSVLDDELSFLVEKYQKQELLIRHKNKIIKSSKSTLLEILKKQVENNERTNGRHHKRVVNSVLTIDDRINIFDSSITRLEPYEAYQLSDNLMVVQVFYFDVFKDLLKFGYLYNGEEYQYFTSSAGQIRTKKAVFIKKSFYEKHEKTIMCGLTVDKINKKGGINPNKFLAYMALTNSATDLWDTFDIDKSIVVDDFETEVSGIFDYVDEQTYTVDRKKGTVPIPHTDGAGMMLPSVSTSNFMVRLPWVKGLLGVFDFKRFITEHNCSPVVKDIYGKEYNVIKDDIQIIFTKSQFKLWKFYDSWDEYKYLFKKYHCSAGICNNDYAIEHERVKNVTINYQMLQTLTDITDAEINELAKTDIQDIKMFCTDKRNFQRALGVHPANYNMTYLQEAIALYPNILNDEFLKVQLRCIKNAMIKNAKAGKIKLKAKYTFLLPDFYAFCEWLFLGIENPNGLLKDKEVFCRLFDDSEELDCLRSPHLYKEHAVRNNLASYDTDEADKARYWFKTYGIYTSTHDLISKILQFDVDGDTSLVVADKTFVNVAKRNMEGIVPLYYNMRKAMPSPLSKDSVYNGLISAFTGGNIGIYSNNISKIWNSDVFITGSKEEQEEAITIIKLLCMENNFVIDYAKTLYKPTRPEEINKKIVNMTKEKLPHFFIYAKDKESNQVCESTDSLVNKLEDITPNPRFNFKACGIGEPDVEMLLNHDISVDFDFALIEYYCKFNREYKYKVGTKSEHDEKIKYLSYFLKKEMSKLSYSEEEVAYMLTKYLYTINSVQKEILWFAYGKYLLENLKNNLNVSREPRVQQCKECRDWFYAYSSNSRFCPICQKARINKRKKIYKESKAERDKREKFRKIRNWKR